MAADAPARSRVGGGDGDGKLPTEILVRQPAEVRATRELEARAADPTPVCSGLAPLAPVLVETFVLGSSEEYRAPDGGRVRISQEYVGDLDPLVQVAIATLASDRALLLVGEPGTAKCVKHDTLVVDTRTGEWLTVEEACRRRDLSVASLGDDLQLSPQQPIAYQDNGVRPCYRVTTTLGRRIEVTLNHPLRTIAGWRPLGDLGVGDRIALPRLMPFFGDAQLSDAHVKLLAHLLAEGCLTQNVPYYSNEGPELQKDFSAAVSEAFPGLCAHWAPDGRNCTISGGSAVRGPTTLARSGCAGWG